MSYTVTIEAGVVQDRQANVYPGLTWTFAVLSGTDLRNI